MRVIFSFPTLQLNGVSIFSLNLIRALRGRAECRIVLTEPFRGEKRPLPRPEDVPVDALPVDASMPWPKRWRLFEEYLRAQAPCVYLPGYDWRHSCVIPRLPEGIFSVGVVHGDDPRHYDHARRLGDYWDAIVGVSALLEEELRRRLPGQAPRIRQIPIGVPLPSRAAARDPGDPLRIIYAGAFKQEQKRVLDVPEVLKAALQVGVRCRLTLAGSGPQEDELKAALEGCPAEFRGSLAHADLLEELARHDVLLLTSDFEGLPNVLLEAMARGCVPLATDIRSGIRQVVVPGENGLLHPVGEPEAFAQSLLRLQRDPGFWRSLSGNAMRTVAGGPYALEAMADAYFHLFAEIEAAAKEGRFRRPKGKVAPPPELAFTQKPLYRLRSFFKG